MKMLYFITMELMQKYVKNNGMTGVDNLQYWPANLNAVSFLWATESASSVSDLIIVSWKIFFNKIRV